MNRLHDLVLAAVGLLLLAIPSLGIILYLALLKGRPVFFCQTRVGRGLRPFTLYKFRTMDARVRGPTLTVGEDPRVQPWGRWMRRYHVDELPQLFNILRGDMSFVGPRPEVPEFVDPNNALQRATLEARPGLVDSATLRWADVESDLLACAEDWEAQYREVILPAKLAASLHDIRTKSPSGDLWMLARVVGRALQKLLPRAAANSCLSHCGAGAQRAIARKPDGS